MVFDSGLAEHTRNPERDQRASLLVAESGSEDPLANGRVTMLGPCARVDEDGGSARAAFLAAHPNSACYADFSDFVRSVSEDPEGPRPVRVAFATPVSTPENVRVVLMAMVKDARSRMRRG